MLICDADQQDFNPRSHERSDKKYINIYNRSKISIHAPTRGATERRWRALKILVISIHAPTRGATVMKLAAVTRGLFQSTLPREERRCDADADGYVSNISIHAPTRGATRSHSRCRCIFPISIHAPTRGATAAYRAYTDGYIFQSTLPREERRSRFKKE